MGLVGYAVVAYAAFLGALGWAVTFLADLHLPRGIDDGVRHRTVPAVLADAALLLLFAAQHSVMARSGFKRRLRRFLPAAAERSTFVLASSLVLLLLLWQWQPMRGRVWDLPAAGAVWALCAAGWVVAVSSTFLVDHTEFFGLRPALSGVRGLPSGRVPFRERGLYAWVRHPMMLGLLVAFWATPQMTAGHLLFAAAASAYIAVGLRFEERELVREVGEVYRDYASRVPAIVPLRPPAGRHGPPSHRVTPRPVATTRREGVHHHGR